jgi:hypothetical protein
MKLVRIRWKRHIALVGKMRNRYKFLVGKDERKRYSEDLGIDEEIILNES